MHLKIERSYGSVSLSLVFPRQGVPDAFTSKEQKDFLGKSYDVVLNYTKFEHILSIHVL